MSYSSLNNLYLIYSEDSIAVLAPDADTPTEVDETKVGEALDQASDLIDSYLSRRYSTPVTPIPDSLIRINAEIAYYLLAVGDKNSTGVTEITQQRYKDAINWLKDVSAGKAILIGATENTSISNDLPLSSSSTRLFSRLSTRWF
jgi:phage gp36-like protein